ncbi:MAG: V-type ATPase subunit [Enterococcus sp.]
MKKELYHQLNPYIRLKETEILTKEFFDQLINSDSFQRIGELLSNTTYGKYIHPGFENDFEASLNQELLATYQELLELAPEKDVIWVYTMRYTFHNLKVLTKAERIGENYDHLYLPDGFYKIEDLKNAIQTGKSALLPDELMASIHEVHEFIEESAILQGIDIIYDRHFLKEQRRLGEKIKNEELLTEIIHLIDLTNIVTTMRCLLQQRSRGFLTAVLSSSGSIEKEVYLDFTDREVSEFVTFVLESPYGDLLRPAIDQAEIDFALLDLIKDNHLTEMFDEAQIKAFGPLPLLAYLNAKDIEMKNLRMLVIGKRSGFTNEQIRERMRNTYDL